MTVAGRWFVTPHAVDRYRERHRPDISRARAVAELALWSEVTTIRTRMRTGTYEAHAAFPAPIRFVVSHDSEGDLPALVTVLPRRSRPTWVNLSLDVALEFEHLSDGSTDRAWDLEMIAPEALAHRRAAYAVERRERSATYRTILHRATARSRERHADPVQRDEQNRRERERHRLDRAERIEGRVCPECGGGVPPRKGRGPTPIYCSTDCNRRVAGRAYWRRNNPGAGAGAIHWTTRELRLLSSEMSDGEIATRTGRSLRAVEQKRRGVMARGGVPGEGGGGV